MPFLAGYMTDQILRFEPASARAMPAGHLPRPIQNASAAAEGGVGSPARGAGPLGTTLSSIVTVKLVAQTGGTTAR